MKLFFLLVIFLFIFSTPVYAQNNNINDIINENLQESTDYFIKSTTEDIETFVVEQVEEIKTSWVESLKENIKKMEIQKNVQKLFSQILSTITEYFNNLKK